MQWSVQQTTTPLTINLKRVLTTVKFHLAPTAKFNFLKGQGNLSIIMAKVLHLDLALIYKKYTRTQLKAMLALGITKDLQKTTQGLGS